MTRSAPETPAVLSIAASDSGGGAGIQADLKAFAACGVHGMTAIVALTAQSTVAVDAITTIAPEMIVAQVRTVQADIGVAAVKIGMLANAETIAAVDRALDALDAGTPIVLDPVMVAESGARLLERDAHAALVERLLPRVTVLTPNLPEARVLAASTAGKGVPDAAASGTGGPDAAASGEGGTAGRSTDASDEGAPDAAAADDDEAERLARAVHALGPRCVVVTGGHRDRAVDVFFDGEALVEIPGERHPEGAAHGSGCTHSSALAAHLAHGFTPLEAARAAKALASAAVRDGLREIGSGAGPVDALGVRARRPGVLSGT